MRCFAKTSRISCAWRYSNAGIPEPVRKVGFAPAAVVFHGIKGAERRIVQDGFIRADKTVAEPGFERTAGGGFKFFQPIFRNQISRFHTPQSTAAGNESK